MYDIILFLFYNNDVILISLKKLLKILYFAIYNNFK